MKEGVSETYWKANIRLVLVLLAVWFVVSFLLGIVFVDYLNEYRFFGYKLGFWFSTQGAIYVFVILVFVYSGCMNSLDKKFGLEED